jgi:hypothetical protein
MNSSSANAFAASDLTDVQLSETNNNDFDKHQSAFKSGPDAHALDGNIAPMEVEVQESSGNGAKLAAPPCTTCLLDIMITRVYTALQWRARVVARHLAMTLGNIEWACEPGRHVRSSLHFACASTKVSIFFHFQAAVGLARCALPCSSLRALGEQRARKG